MPSHLTTIWNILANAGQAAPPLTAIVFPSPRNYIALRLTHGQTATLCPTPPQWDEDPPPVVIATWQGHTRHLLPTRTSILAFLALLAEHPTPDPNTPEDLWVGQALRNALYKAPGNWLEPLHPRTRIRTLEANPQGRQVKVGYNPKTGQWDTHLLSPVLGQAQALSQPGWLLRCLLPPETPGDRQQPAPGHRLPDPGPVIEAIEQALLLYELTPLEDDPPAWAPLVRSPSQGPWMLP